MMLEVPPLTPFSKPVAKPIVATEVVPLVHVPPGDVLLSVVDVPAHTVSNPLMAAGVGFTVSVRLYVVAQPVVEFLITSVPKKLAAGNAAGTFAMIGLAGKPVKVGCGTGPAGDHVSMYWLGAPVVPE